MEKEITREVYETYFMDILFRHMLLNHASENVSFGYIRDRAKFTTDIYLEFLFLGKHPSFALEKALCILLEGFNEETG